MRYMYQKLEGFHWFRTFLVMDKQNGFVFANLPYKFNSYNSNVENVVFAQEKLFFIINYSGFYVSLPWKLLSFY